MADISKFTATDDIAIKIVTHILDAELEIEIKKNADEYLVLIILSKSDYYEESGKVWNGKMAFENVRRISSVISDCYRNPSIAKSIAINDGRTINIRWKENGSAIDFAIDDIYDGTVESKLMQEVYSSIHAIIKDAVLEKYLKIFGFS